MRRLTAAVEPALGRRTARSSEGATPRRQSRSASLPMGHQPQPMLHRPSICGGTAGGVGDSAPASARHPAPPTAPDAPRGHLQGVADAAGHKGLFMPLADSIPWEAQSSFAWRMRVFAGIAAIQELAMLRDDSGNGGGRPSSPRNVLGGRLDVCSMEPKTGFFRDGCCNTNGEDIGSHTVCTVMTAEFLEFSNSRGNDLSTPMPQFGFPASGPATAGACVRPAGAKHWRRAARPAWSCGLLTKARSTTARSPISSVSPWTSPELDHRTRRAHTHRGARGDELGGGSSSQAPRGPRPSADGWRPASLQSEPTVSN